jgi:hypothetical protein
MKEKTIEVKRKRLVITNRAWFGVGIAMMFIAIISLFAFKEMNSFAMTKGMLGVDSCGSWILLSLFGFVAYNLILIWVSLSSVERWEKVKIRE